MFINVFLVVVVTFGTIIYLRIVGPQLEKSIVDNGTVVPIPIEHSLSVRIDDFVIEIGELLIIVLLPYTLNPVSGFVVPTPTESNVAPPIKERD